MGYIRTDRSGKRFSGRLLLHFQTGLQPAGGSSIWRSLLWIKQAIEEAGSDDPAAIRDALENTDSFDGLLGHMSVDPATHNPSRDAAVFTIKDDTVEYVGIYEPDEAK